MSAHYDWSVLNTSMKSLKESIWKDWMELLKHRKKEEAYHAFLAEHAGFFLVRDLDVESIVISKLRLGANHVVDFVKTYDNRSVGLQYEFMELETPWCAPYTNNGKPSSRLMQAVQQIEDWKRWRKENRYELQKLLFLYNRGLARDERYKYTIIIGNSEQNQQHIEKRNQFANDIGIRIRSFDYLSQMFRKHWFHEFENPHLFENSSIEESNALANPFFRAYSDQDWRRLVETYKRSQGRMRLVECLLKARKYNDRFDKFKARYRLIHKKIIA